MRASCCRGLDMMNAAYHYLDLMSLGRQRRPALFEMGAAP